MKLPFFVCPAYDVNIGNLSETIHFSLLKAIRLNRPANLVRKRIYLPQHVKKRFGLRQLQALFCLRSPFLDAHYHTLGDAVGHIMGLRFLSHFTLQAAKRLIRLTPYFHFATPSCGLEDIYNLTLAKEYDESLVAQADWGKQLATDLNLNLPSSLNIACTRDLESLGLQTKHFVCLHVRTPHFHNDPESNLYRNANPEAYNKAIDYIISQGISVIRLGDPVPGIFTPRKGYIDYPTTAYKSEMMDLFLIKNCLFYIGMNSGIIDTAYLLNKPVLGVNITDYLFSKPYKEIDRYIYKKIYSKKLNRPLLFSELLDSETDIHSNVNEHFWRRFVERYSQIDNTAEEILEAVQEMHELCTPRTTEIARKASPEQLQAAQHIAQASRRWLREADFADMLDNRYRACIKSYNNGLPGRHFIATNYA